MTLIRMSKALKWIGIAAAVLVVAIQFLRPERTNPPVDISRTIQARTAMPLEVVALLNRACRDCHTYETRWPWYSHVAPVMWFVADHVDEGRDHLNLSDWARYDARAASHKLEEMCEEVRKGEMPLRSYLRFHPGARLASSDVKTLCDWTLAGRGRTGAEKTAKEPKEEMEEEE